jgi:hypothetical protein
MGGATVPSAFYSSFLDDRDGLNIADNINVRQVGKK